MESSALQVYCRLSSPLALIYPGRMYAVVNMLPLGKPLDEDLLREVEEGLLPRMREALGFLDMHLIRVSRHVVAGGRGPVVRRALRPYLAGPAERSVGEVAAHAGKSEPE
jgi:hypothetical protein